MISTICLSPMRGSFPPAAESIRTLPLGHWPASRIDLRTRLAGLLGRLRRNDASLRVWQLGDCFDLWRTDGIGGNPEDDVSSTQDSHEALFKLLYGDVGVQILAGNHDQELLEF